MEIDKILFGQLSQSKSIDKSFEDLDINSDGKINESDKTLANDDIKEIISNLMGLEDEDSELVSDDLELLEEETTTANSSETNNAPAISQNQVIMLSAQLNTLTREQEKIQEEKDEKADELADLEKEIETKQEEYETLSKELENSDDTSKTDKATELLNEIQSLQGQYSFLQTEISDLETKLNSKSSEINLINSQLETAQATLTDSIASQNTTQSVTETQKVTEVSDIEETTSVQSTQSVSTTATTQKTDRKMQEEYNEILNDKFDEVWEKCNGDMDAISTYIKNNMVDFADIDDDGRITQIDLQILHNYHSNAQTCLTSKSEEWQERGRDYVYSRSEIFAKTIQTSVSNTTISLYNSELFDLQDLEDFYRLGGSCNISGQHSQLNILAISKEENWEEKLSEIIPKTYLNRSSWNNLKNEIEFCQQWCQSNPDNEGLWGIAFAYQNCQDINNDTSFANLISSTFQNEHLIDTNGNSTLDLQDISAICENIDLDGDGVVSNKEKEFLSKIKENLQETIYSKSRREGYENINTIDDVISTIEICDEAYAEQLTDKYKQSIGEAFIQSFGIDGSVSVGGAWFHCVMSAVTSHGNNMLYQGYKDKTDPLVNMSEKSEYNYTELQKLIEETVQYIKPQNTYLHYIKSADLSKCELEEILSKINNASESAQSQLTEVKQAVEEKIAALSEQETE